MPILVLIWIGLWVICKLDVGASWSHLSSSERRHGLSSFFQLLSLVYGSRLDISAGATSASLPSALSTLLGVAKTSSSLGNLLSLLSEIQQTGRPSFLMTEVDMASLGGAENCDLGGQGAAFDDGAERSMFDRLWESL